MSEPKRATLTSFGSQKGGENKVKEVPKTVRISLTLRESNEKACPEHNYRDLLASAEKKLRAKLLGNGEPNGNSKFDAFDDDNDDDVRRIAQQMEAKYGQSPIAGKKKHRRKKDEYADIGMGYDENDSFIDNTDGYDEMIPPQVTTAHGGFYINSGALEFKTDDEASSESSESDEEDDGDEEGAENRRTPDKQQTTAVNRKRILQTSESEAEGEDETEAKGAKAGDPVEKKLKLNVNGVQKAVKKKLFIKEPSEGSSEKHKFDGDLKKKSFTVKELLREKREDLRIPSNGEENKNQDKKTSITIDNIIESVISAARTNSNQESNIKEYNNEDNNVNNVNPTSSESDSNSESVTSEGVNREIVKLPENLPQQVLDLINELIRLANNSEGRFKLISPTTNKLLLKLERESRFLSKLSRVKIYEHLAPFCRHKKETLQRRAKNLLVESETKNMAEPIKKLKGEVDRLMPNLLQKYEVELKKVMDKKFSKEAAGGEEGTKSIRLPHKRFPWSDEMKTLLRDIVTNKKRCLVLGGVEKEACEPLIAEFLKKELIPLWPDGWMSYNSLCNKSTGQPGQKGQHQNTKHPKNAHGTNQNPASSSSLTLQNKFLKVDELPSSMSSALSTTATTTLLHSGTTLTPIAPSATAESPQSLTQPHSALTITPITTSSVNGGAPSLLTSASSKSALTVTPASLAADTSIITIDDSPCKPATVTPVIVVPPKMEKVPPVQIEPLPLTISSVAPVSSMAVTVTATAPSKPALDAAPAAIIDLTESTKKKPGPKSKTRYPTAILSQAPDKEKHHHHHHKKELPSIAPSLQQQQQLRDGLALNLADGVSSGKIKEEQPLTGTAALTQLITDSLTGGGVPTKMKVPKLEPADDMPTPTTSVGSASSIPSAATASGMPYASVKQEVKSEPGVGDNDLLQVMENLKELQKMQQERRSMESQSSPASSPVSVIAVNCSYSPNKQPLHTSQQQQQPQHQQNEISPKVQPAASPASLEAAGFQDIFHKHLFPDISLTRSATTSLHSSTVTPATVKTSFNSIDSNPYPYPRTNILSPISSYSKFMPQSTTMSNSHSNKYTNSVKSLQQKPTDMSQQDELFLFQNIMFGNGFPSASGTKHQNPSSSH